MVFHAVENQLLLDGIARQQFLVKGTDAAFERIRNAKVFARDQLLGRSKLDLQQPAANIELDQVDAVLMEGSGGVLRRIEDQFRAREQAIHGGGKIQAD